MSRRSFAIRLGQWHCESGGTCLVLRYLTRQRATDGFNRLLNILHFSTARNRKQAWLLHAPINRTTIYLHSLCGQRQGDGLAVPIDLVELLPSAFLLERPW